MRILKICPTIKAGWPGFLILNSSLIVSWSIVLRTSRICFFFRTPVVVLVVELVPPGSLYLCVTFLRGLARDYLVDWVLLITPSYTVLVWCSADPLNRCETLLIAFEPLKESPPASLTPTFARLGVL